VRVVLQRVARASVTVGGDRIAEIGQGLLLLVGVGKGDDEELVPRLADKIVNLRIFADDEGKMNLSVLDVSGEALVVSQFTLYAAIRRGRRPSWTEAEDPGVAEEMIEKLTTAIQGQGVRIARGSFGANMQVELLNDGPVTILLDTDFI
jgi:D-tyrosyl-tRNA(Tyr) deacylase